MLKEIWSQFTWQPATTGPLGKHGEFLIWVKGPITATYLKHMRAQLDLVISWVKEDEAAAVPVQPSNE